MFGGLRTTYVILGTASFLFLLWIGACSPAADSVPGPAAPSMVRTPKPPPNPCDADNGGLTLPTGFCAAVFADNLGAARHIAVATNGDVYVAIANRGTSTGGVIGLRDTDGDGRSDQRAKFGDNGGNGVAYLAPYLYFAQDDRVLRYGFGRKSIAPTSTATVISGLPSVTEHVTKTIAFRDATLMYINIGSASNSCQVANRQAGSPGIDPCPELATRAGVWSLDPRVLDQSPSSAGVQRVATGLRNMVALATDVSGQLFGVQMDRDNLAENWPALYSSADDARLPAEEFIRIDQGTDFGWPYCYYDATLNAKVLAPEYGGDKVTVGRCAGMSGPLLSLPAHWAPLSMTFYQGTAFPSRYRGGAFVAFHGDYFWGTRPRSDSPGYNVVFVPFGAGAPTGAWEVFADGFAGASATSRATAAYRPTGLAQGPDGSLYVADDVKGRVWRIVYRGI